MNHFALALITLPDGTAAPSIVPYTLVEWLRRQPGVIIQSGAIADEEARRMLDRAATSIGLADGLDTFTLRTESEEPWQRS